MKNEKLLERKSAVYQMGLLFNQQPNDDKITAYANALMNYEPKQIIFAFKKVIDSGSAFFPSLAEILKHLRPAENTKEDKAPIIVNEIIQFIRLHPFDLEKNHTHTLSTEALEVIIANGGTRAIRDSENFETMKAQLERLAKGVIANRDAGIKNEALQKIGIDTMGKILPMNKPEFRTIDYSGYLPTEGA